MLSTVIDGSDVIPKEQGKRPGGAVYADCMATEVLLGVLVLTAIFFMTAQPFA